jgi:acyl carrier protein
MSIYKEEIKTIVAEIIEVDHEEIGDDTNLVVAFGADSMMALEILATIEKKYKIIIPEDELKNLITLNGIVSVAEKYMKC